MFSEYFIDRPRFAGVISVIMILLGLLAPDVEADVISLATARADYAAADCRFHHLSRCQCAGFG